MTRKSFIEWNPGLAADFVAGWEGCRFKAYRCPAGLWTIGYGHTDGVKEGDTVTSEEAKGYLAEDLVRAAKQLARSVKVKVTGNQYIALLSLAFNVGPSLPKKAPKLFASLNAGDEKGAASQFLDINRANGRPLPGLTMRRRAEAKLFLEGE